MPVSITADVWYVLIPAFPIRILPDGSHNEGGDPKAMILGFGLYTPPFPATVPRGAGTSGGSCTAGRWHRPLAALAHGKMDSIAHKPYTQQL